MRKQHAKVSYKYNRQSRVKSGGGGGEDEEREKDPKEEMKKDKGVAVVTDELDDNKPDDPSLRPFRFASRNASSKYDFVKVKVWLGGNADHYYVLSRFLLSRMLTVTKIPNHVAIKIALELKKLLIDNSLLDVSQNDLEANLFKLMERRGYGEEYINRYKMMTRFHHQRVPLVILVCGTACTGKSTIATQLAQRLNLPNVLQTDMVYELLRTSTDAPLTSTPVWAREFNSSEEFVTEFCRECRIVRKGLAGDLKKAMKDGKPIIIEGTHIDPSIYLMDDDNKLHMKMRPKVEGAEVSSNLSTENSTCHIPKQPTDNTSSEEQVSCDQKHEILDSLASVNIEDKVSDDKVGSPKETKMDENPQMKKQRSGAEPIIVPIVLKMAEFDHEALLEEWIPTRTFSDNSIVKDKNKLMKNLKVIQDYLCSFESQGLTVVNISATTFPQTLDGLHSYLLQCIEEGISAVSTPKQQD